LVRLSTQAGCFTIQTPELRVRIIYIPSKGFQEERGAKDVWFADLPSLIKTFMASRYTECGDSEFSSIYGGKKTMPTQYGELGISAESWQSNAENINKILAHTGKKED